MTPDQSHFVARLDRGLRAWYRLHGRHTLPWRLTRDPYAVLVSEVMLQQTQVDRVLSYYGRWIARWPGFDSLAAANPGDAIREWAGLGYNRRALHLHAAASAVVTRFGGRLPPDVPTLRALPGIGPYTAAAVACFAFGRPVPLADTNIARVIARSVLAVESQKEAGPAAVAEAAAALLPRRNARDYNLALMDLGALVCTARNPSCDRCPLRRACAWHAAGRPSTSTPASAAATPFELTSRFARGRIIDALRRSPLDEAALTALLPAPHQPNLSDYLAALARDGLVTRAGDCWSLPGCPADHSSSIASPKL